MKLPCASRTTGELLILWDNKIPALAYTVKPGNPCESDPLSPPSLNVPTPCSNGNLSGVDFAIIINPWFQGVGADMRLDGGFTDRIPGNVPDLSRYACLKGSGGTPGLIFAGDGTTPPDYGKGEASETRWQVYGEGGKFAPGNSGIRTSYSYISAAAAKNSLIPTKLPCEGGFSDCDLPLDLANGLYKPYSIDPSEQISLTLNNYTFPPNKNYVILVDGNLEILGNIIVPNGSTVTFAVSEDIIIDKNVGETNINSSNVNVEGFYSAGGSIILDGTNGDCSASFDKRLNIGGLILANANLESGSLQNKRDLCEKNFDIPSFTGSRAVTGITQFQINKYYQSIKNE
ncbi:MAG: hypothetical protein HYV39_00240 [Candidatus Levybacteria bacterium]|nr:hypothetical protein [Candidatus Levybacteria bacterium]